MYLQPVATWFPAFLGFDRPAAATAARLPAGHIPALDAIRGLAIVLVTVYRFGGGTAGVARAVDTSAWMGWGSRGVDLFFVLSGFLITGILVDAKGKSHYFRNFYARRALRIFPLYYGVLIGLLIAWCVSALPGATSGGATGGAYQAAYDHQAWLWCYGANLAQTWRGQWCLGPLDHFWSLAVEEHFYLIWPWVILAAPIGLAKHICLGLVAVSVVGRPLWLALGGNDVAVDVFTPLRMDGLALGGWLALVAREPGGLQRLARVAAPVFWAVLPLAAAVALLDRRLLGLPHTIWSVLFAALLILVLVAPPCTLLARLGDSRVLGMFGKYSYGMYVFQSLLIPLLAPIVSAPALAVQLGSPVAAQLVYLVSMFAITTALAVLSWHGFERRFLALKPRFEQTILACSPMESNDGELRAATRAAD